MKKNIEAILQDLYELDPSLKQHKRELEKIVRDLLDAKPDVEVNPQFLKNLRSQLRVEAQTHLIENKNLNPNPFSMFKRIFLPLSGVVALGVIIAIILVRLPENKTTDAPMFAMQNKIIKMEPGAFGSLAEATYDAKIVREASPTAVSMDSTGVAGSSMPTTNPAFIAPTPNQTTSLDKPVITSEQAPSSLVAPIPPAPNTGGGATATATDEAKMAPNMIVPQDYIPTVYKYVYKGEPVALADKTVDVFKRIPQKADTASLANTLKNFGFGLMDMSGFNGLQAQYMSLKQDQNEGYIFDINFEESSVGINQNWEKWDYPSSKCGDDQKCYEDTRLKESDIPADEALLSIANEFLKSHQINTANYGTPVIQKQWERDFRIAQQQGIPAPELYVPDTINIVYPILLNGQAVSDQSGNPMGLTVGVNLYHKKVGSVYGLRVDQFQSSAYDAITDWKTVDDYLAKGGTPYPIYYDMTGSNSEVKVEEIELGAPEKVLVSVWNYNPGNNMGNELYTPALKFPIVQPKGDYIYQENIIVPLAKELLQQDNGGIRPLMMDKAASGIIAPVAETTAPSTTPAAPAVPK